MLTLNLLQHWTNNFPDIIEQGPLAVENKLR